MHNLVLIVGTKENFAAAKELYPQDDTGYNFDFFGYDYITPLDECPLRKYGFQDSELGPFTKADAQYEKYVKRRMYYECLDLRYPDQQDWNIVIVDNTDDEPEKEIQHFFDSLPEDATFFFCDGHC